MSRKPKLTKKQVVKLVSLYKNPKMSMEKLCKFFQISDDTITRTIKREGITARKTAGFCDKENSNWKGGLSRHYAKNVAMRHFKKNNCAICGYKISVDVHHRDNNNRNNKPDNLVLLCPNHHREAHLGLLKSHK
ncbi:MAG: hypothetical protein WC475_02170 [Candidatus Paceibacterota bacterium]